MFYLKSVFFCVSCCEYTCNSKKGKIIYLLFLCPTKVTRAPPSRASLNKRKYSWNQVNSFVKCILAVVS